MRADLNSIKLDVSQTVQLLSHLRGRNCNQDQSRQLYLHVPRHDKSRKITKDETTYHTLNRPYSSDADDGGNWAAYLVSVLPRALHRRSKDFVQTPCARAIGPSMMAIARTLATERYVTPPMTFAPKVMFSGNHH